MSRYVVGPTGCWLWTGHTDRDGYAKTGGRLTHRLMYERYCGAIPAGMELDHLCRNRRCVNPNHLEPVTHAENVRRSEPAQKTSCVNGHAYDEANTYVRPTGQRDCRKCIAARSRSYQQRRRAA